MKIRSMGRYRDSGRATGRQLSLLSFIEQFHAEHGYPPSRVEMMTAKGIGPNATHCLLESLQKRGLIKGFRTGKGRSVMPLAKVGVQEPFICCCGAKTFVQAPCHHQALP